MGELKLFVTCLVSACIFQVSCFGRQKKYNLVSSKRIVNAVVKNFTASSKMVCGDLCLQEKGCLSFNFKSVDNLCRLFPCVSQSSLVDDSDWDFYTSACAVAGTTNECTDMGATNLQHFYYPSFHSTTKHGIVTDMTYDKKLNHTSLRVQFRAVLRTTYMKMGCTRWYFRINGQPCQHPGPIEITWFGYGMINRYHSSRVDGICDSIAAGEIVVELAVEPCDQQIPPATCDTGWPFGTGLIGLSITLEENDMGKTAGICSSLSRFNIQQALIDKDIVSKNGTLWSREFEKRADDTAIHVIFIGTLMVQGLGLTQWTILFNGSTCKDPGPVSGILTNDREFGTMDSTNGVDGICNGLASGKMNVSLHASTNNGDITVAIGYGSPSRWIVEEMRMGFPNAVDVTYGESPCSVADYNIQQWYWHSGDPTDVGILKFNVSFHKQSSTSYLRVYYHGALRQTNLCSKWYFLLNNKPCEEPGTIAGGIYSEVLHHGGINDQDHVMMIDGFCMLPAGEITIQLYVDSCDGIYGNDAYTCNGGCRIVAQEVCVNE